MAETETESMTNVCIYTETLAIGLVSCIVKERKFDWLKPSPIEDGGQLDGRELDTSILPVSRLQFNPDGQPDRCVLTR